MLIHIVQKDETISAIAQSYNVPIERLVQDNGITAPYDLVVGQTLVIVYPKEIYIVESGDTLAGIADAHGITLMELLRNNPHLSDREFIYPGEPLVIRYEDEKIMKISTNGYAYPFIDHKLLRKILPYLTYLTIFNYRITPKGELIDIEDEELIQIAKGYGVAPIMLVSTFTAQGTSGEEIAHVIFNNISIQITLINNILSIMKAKGYYGLTIDSQNILHEDRENFLSFIKLLSDSLNNEGYELTVTITPFTFQTEYIYEVQEFRALAEEANKVMLLSYEWGHTFGPPVAVTPIQEVRDLLNFAVTMIPVDKINIGIPTIGYDWHLPYIEGVSMANSISSVAAVELARDVGATIFYNKDFEAPFFMYEGDTPSPHIVWFKDARSIEALVGLLPEFDIHGIGIWNIMFFFYQMWLIINVKFDIKRIDMGD